jgi:hypothetical protein
MTSEKFPEAFRRFEERVNTDKIETFRQLTLAFGSWAGQKWVPTWRQTNALAVEAERLGIPIQGERGRRVFRSHWIWQPTWKYETITVRGRIQYRYRDNRTGRFIKKP